MQADLNKRKNAAMEFSEDIKAVRCPLRPSPLGQSQIMQFYELV